MAHSQAHADSAVRDHLVAWYCDLRQSWVNTARKGGPDEELEAAVHKELDPRIDALLAGQALRFHRFELPDNHPQGPPHGGNPNDWLELGADDVVRSCESDEPRSIPPNRAQRRAMGWRGDGLNGQG